jgi:hypothetical protein
LADRGNLVQPSEEQKNPAATHDLIGTVDTASVESRCDADRPDTAPNANSHSTFPAVDRRQEIPVAAPPPAGRPPRTRPPTRAMPRRSIAQRRQATSRRPYGAVFPRGPSADDFHGTELLASKLRCSGAAECATAMCGWLILEGLVCHVQVRHGGPLSDPVCHSVLQGSALPAGAHAPGRSVTKPVQLVLHSQPAPPEVQHQRRNGERNRG